MHQVKRRRMPLLRTFTGCRCRKTFVRMTRPRFLAVSGGPCRKIEFQSWVLRVYSQSFFKTAIGSLSTRLRGAPPPGPRPSGLQERLGIAPVALLLGEDLRLVDQDLPVFGQDDAVALERARRGAFVVDPAAVEAAAVTGALELVLGLQPVRRAPEVRADGAQDVDAVVVAHDEHAEALLEALVDRADLEVGGEAGLELLRWLEQHVREHEPRGGDGPGAAGRREGGPGDSERGQEPAASNLDDRPGGGQARLTCY